MQLARLLILLLIFFAPRVWGETTAPVGVATFSTGHQQLATSGVIERTYSTNTSYNLEVSIFAAPRYAIYLGFKNALHEKDLQRALFYEGQFGLRYYLSSMSSQRVTENEFSTINYDRRFKPYLNAFGTLGRVTLNVESSSQDVLETGSEFYGLGLGGGLQISFDSGLCMMTGLDYEQMNATSYSPVAFSAARIGFEIGIGFVL